MDRRKVLALALFALLAAAAGCSAQGLISMEPVDDASLTERASTDITTLEPGQDRALIRAAIENGSATTVDHRPPVDEQLPFRYEGAFYDIAYAEAGSQSGYEADIGIDYNASSVDGTVVDYEDLPAVDRTALEILVTPPDIPEDKLEPGYDFGVEVTYTESEANASVLVPGQEYDAVRHEGEVYPISVEAAAEMLTVYRYESTLVADSVAEYATALRDSYEFELSGLSEAERDVLDDALNGTNYIEDSDNEGFDSLVDRFRSHRAVAEDDFAGYYIVQYDGQRYWVEVDYGSYLDDEDA